MVKCFVKLSKFLLDYLKLNVNPDRLILELRRHILHKIQIQQLYVFLLKNSVNSLWEDFKAFSQDCLKGFYACCLVKCK